MNDRFKFRVWNKEQQKLYSWDDLKKSKGDNSFYWCMLQAQNDEKNNILMQSTGLKDKNGKLIYEGDIVRVYPFEYNGEIIFENYFYLLRANLAYLGVQKLSLVELERIRMNLEVIGNIYENKELLEDTECQK